MKDFEEKLLKYIEENQVEGQHLTFTESCHSVEEAARAAGVLPENLVKNICMMGESGELIVAIVKGEDRVSLSKVGKALNIRTPRIATAEEILEKTGYPCGGVPSFGYPAQFLIDSRVTEMEVVYTGGGSQTALMRIAPSALLRANGGTVTDIRK